LSDGFVSVRPWSSADANWVFEACQDPDIQRWTRVPVPYTEGDASGFVSELSPTNWKNQRGAHFAVVDAVTSQGLGSVGVQAHDLASGVGEAGYWTAPDARGIGSTTRALGLLTVWAFERGGFVRLELLIEETNTKSKAVAERTGYVCEGVLAKKVWKHGDHRNVALYARTI
jgi:RimJ/RimL family protein N-acetyltransferase